MFNVAVHCSVDIDRTTLSTTRNSILFANCQNPFSSKSESKTYTCILMKGMGGVQGYAIGADFFNYAETKKNAFEERENKQKNANF